MRQRTLLIAAITAVLTMVLAVAVPTLADAITPDRTGPVAPQRRPGADGAPQRPAARDVVVDFQGDYFGWAMLDRRDGEVIGQDLTATSSTESMIKPWLVADNLHRAQEQGRTPGADQLQQATAAIRRSDDGAAERLYQVNGGDESIRRMISMCGLRDTSVHPGWWSRTQMSPRDAVGLADCIGDGRAAGPRWTPWLLNEMRNVTGTTSPADQHPTSGGGRWGIIDGVPTGTAGDLAIKNGWTAIGADGSWHLNCLAVNDEWAMAVMLRYPIDSGLDYGSDMCAQVARQLTNRP